MIKAHIPGYDAICSWCMAAYTLANAKRVKTVDYKKYCSPSCENHSPVVTEKNRERNRRVGKKLRNSANQRIHEDAQEDAHL